MPLTLPGPASEDPRPTVACPCCAETILAAARKCRHCGEWVDSQAEDEETVAAGAEYFEGVNDDREAGQGDPITLRETTSRLAGLPFALFSLLPFPLKAGIVSMIVPGWGQAANGRLFQALVWLLAAIGLDYVSLREWDIRPLLAIHLCSAIGAFGGAFRD